MGYLKLLGVSGMTGMIGVLKETVENEKRVALSPENIKKLKQKGFSVLVETGAGEAAGFSDLAYTDVGAQIVNKAQALSAALVLKISEPTVDETAQMKSGSWLIGLLDPFARDFTQIAQAGINAVAMELIPRTSRAQSMDVLSSQANIAGYRAVLEASLRYPRFFPMMMTSAGMARPAKVIVLGVGVAGLQAIATARRLGATVDAFDIRPDVKEQILSLGAKFVEIDVGESGTGAGGYAKELSTEGKARQQAGLTERLKKYDIIISTASIPGRRAPTLITEEAVQGMRAGSVIIDMAAGSGGNCALTAKDQVIQKYGVTIVGITNYPSLLAADASQFFGANVITFIDLLVQKKENQLEFVTDFNDDIIAAAVVTFKGQVRWTKK
jgi:NAD(P) transhydrogenase subunit alpha